MLPTLGSKLPTSGEAKIKRLSQKVSPSNDLTQVTVARARTRRL